MARRHTKRRPSDFEKTLPTNARLRSIKWEASHGRKRSQKSERTQESPEMNPIGPLDHIYLFVIPYYWTSNRGGFRKNNNNSKPKGTITVVNNKPFKFEKPSFQSKNIKITVAGNTKPARTTPSMRTTTVRSSPVMRGSTTSRLRQRRLAPVANVLQVCPLTTPPLYEFDHRTIIWSNIRRSIRCWNWYEI